MGQVSVFHLNFLISLGEDSAYSLHGEDRNGSERWISIKESQIRCAIVATYFFPYWHSYLSILILFIINLSGLNNICIIII